MKNSKSQSLPFLLFVLTVVALPMSLLFLQLPAKAAATKSSGEPKGSAVRTVGEVLRMKGEVWAINYGAKHIIRTGAEIHAGDELVTLERSFVRVKLQDGSLLNLGPHSHLILEDVSGHINQSGSVVYRLAHGMLRAKFSKKAKRGKISIKTHHAALGIWGTELIVEAIGPVDDHHSKVVVLHGDVHMHAKHPEPGKSKKFMLKPGHHFHSKHFRSKGLQATHQKMDHEHINHLKENGDAFLHDVHRKGEKHPVYQHPPHWKNLEVKKR